MNNNSKILVFLRNKTTKGIERSDYSIIDENIFSGREDVVKIVLPEGVREIEHNAFEDCYNLQEVVLPSSLERIGEEAFANCINLVHAEYCSNVDVNPTAFNGCQRLQYKVEK